MGKIQRPDIVQKRYVSEDEGNSIFVRSAMCYVAEAWAMRSEEENRIETTEMRMLRMMCGKTLKHKARNQNIRKIVQVENIREYLRSLEVEMEWLRGKNESTQSTSHEKGMSGLRQEDRKTKEEMANSY